MHFENQARVPVARETMWAFLMDIPQMGACIPGVEDVRQVDADNYLGAMKIRVGPISLKFEGKLVVAERDEANGRAVMKAEGADKRAGGAVKATITLSLQAVSANETELQVVTEANVMGKLGEFGQPVMRKKADGIMKEFSDNLAKRVTGSAWPAV